MDVKQAGRPALLVSVRSVEEAVAAIAGGCDVLDVKEPRRGSLGAADAATIEAIGEAVTFASDAPPVSVALGELCEWEGARAVPQLPATVSFAKVGLSGCRHDRDWLSRWQNLRRRVDDAGQGELGWIAVVYADDAADGPSAELLLDVAVATGCRGVLVDTFQKDRGRLLDHVPLERLAGWRQTAADAEILFAVAGSLRLADVERVAALQPDIIAVRGAACGGGERTASICTTAVTRLSEVLKALSRADRAALRHSAPE